MTKIVTTMEAAEATTAAEATPAVPNIAAISRAGIRAGLSNAEVVAQIKLTHPHARSSPASVAWYRNDMRLKGEHIPSPREIKPVVAAEPKDPSVVKAPAKPRKAKIVTTVAPAAVDVEAPVATSDAFLD